MFPSLRFLLLEHLRGSGIRSVNSLHSLTSLIDLLPITPVTLEHRRVLSLRDDNIPPCSSKTRCGDSDHSTAMMESGLQEMRSDAVVSHVTT
jgi:hypothetical protein